MDHKTKILKVLAISIIYGIASGLSTPICKYGDFNLSTLLL